MAVDLVDQVPDVFFFGPRVSNPMKPRFGSEYDSQNHSVNKKSTRKTTEVTQEAKPFRYEEQSSRMDCLTGAGYFSNIMELIDLL